MNLPEFNKLQENQSTYITFSKALLDYDYAINNSKEYYFSKMVAINLPPYLNPDFFIDLTSVGISNNNPNGPNYFIPKGFQYYMENIIRQNTNTEYITELAFYKFLNKCGISYDKIFDEIIVFVNEINTENFTKVENNNGWGEIVMQIPNNSKQLIKAFKNVEINDLILADITNGNDTGLFDNKGEKSFSFSEPLAKRVLDFDNITYNEVDKNTFNFNAILVFYKDSYGINKLHGINFIAPFENKVTQWVMPVNQQKTNSATSIGYLFKMNVKTVNNEASLIMIEEQNSGPAHWETYFSTMNKFNEFLELHKTKLLGNN